MVPRKLLLLPVVRLIPALAPTPTFNDPELYYTSPILYGFKDVDPVCFKKYFLFFKERSLALVQGYDVIFDQNLCIAQVKEHPRETIGGATKKEVLQAFFAIFELAVILAKNCPLYPGQEIMVTQDLQTMTTQLRFTPRNDELTTLEWPVGSKPLPPYLTKTSNATDSEFPATTYNKHIYNTLNACWDDSLNPATPAFYLKITPHYKEKQPYLHIKRIPLTETFEIVAWRTFLKRCAFFYATGFITEELIVNPSSPLFRPTGENLANNVIWEIQQDHSIKIFPLPYKLLHLKIDNTDTLMEEFEEFKKKEQAIEEDDKIMKKK